MISYQLVAGRHADGDLPVLAVNALDLALASIPSWQCLLEPERPIFPGVLNSATGATLLPALANWDASYFGTLPSSGRAAFKPIATNNGLISDFAMNPNEWTIFFVINDTPSSPSGSRDIVCPSVIAGTTGLSPRISLRTSQQLTVYNTNATVIRVQATNAVTSGQTAFFMVTFSTAEGLRIWKNGAVIAENLSDKNPLNEKFSATQFQFWQENSGSGTLLGGLTGVLSRDLALSANAADRALIQSWIATYYGITMA